MRKKKKSGVTFPFGRGGAKEAVVLPYRRARAAREEGKRGEKVLLLLSAFSIGRGS